MKRKLFFLILFLSLVILSGCYGTKEKTPLDTNKERAEQILDSLYNNYSIKNSDLLRENYPYEPRHKKCSYLWPYSGTFSAVNALLQTTNDDKYKKLLDEKVLPGLKEYFDEKRNPPAYASYIRTEPQSDRFFDDNIWLGIEFTNMYQLTNELQYLERARMIWNFIESGMDDVLDGGIYWCEQRKESKNTCSNAPAAVYALKLFKATHDSIYLKQGKELYTWTQKHLQDPKDYLYFDNIKLDGRVDKRKYAYNSGQMMQAAALLYQFTGETFYLTEAQDIAKACHNYFFTDFTSDTGDAFRILKKGDCWFSAVMLRGYIELYQIDKNRSYLDDFNNSLDYAWNHARQENGLFNVDLSGASKDNSNWLLTQAAMVEMYARMAAVNLGGPARKTGKKSFREKLSFL